MSKIKIVKDGIVRSIHEKDTAKWAARGYMRVEALDPKAIAKAKAEAEAKAKAEAKALADANK
jgi:hypothetical protein